ncbi:NAD-dependent epimerase/dehydratase family protein [Alteromonas sp. a30]|uniref:NAD-dependent epimerase/dehydratase family protein n=1 Tax=Alteromonas sp. a30 TaxID=2730917 RepID=UPI00227EF611|nr:NAD(P)-dependent oxidoreductase [Alteromonas sp. a30]MCY7296870.1 NAD(P)-dependent oxidoreductase [Alteromonas sp. a30]
MKKILITGHLGLIGRHLSPLLTQQGYEITGFDTANNSGDICNTFELNNALKQCCGVIHLAAVSRVIWGQNNPKKCWQTNAIASEMLLKLAAEHHKKPWVLVASSREVYGEPNSLPVSESMTLSPVNIYGRSKLYMEDATLKARTAGLNTAIVRLANVYGCTLDHADRVLPAFSKNAALGANLRVDGFDHLFDFTHVSDTVNGIARIIELLNAGERNLPPIHLLPGHGTTLREAAEFAISAAGSKSSIIEATSRAYDVAKFIGDPSRARNLLGWQANILPEKGISLLVEAFKQKLKLGVVA